MRVFAYTLALLVPPFPEATPEAVREELVRMQGTWKVTAVTLSGLRIPSEQFRRNRLVVKGNQFTLTESGVVHLGTFDVDPAAAPRTIDIHFTDGPRKGDTVPGIYKVQGDTYHLCTGVGDTRPADFAGKAGQMVQILTRIKP